MFMLSNYFSNVCVRLKHVEITTGIKSGAPQAFSINNFLSASIQIYCSSCKDTGSIFGQGSYNKSSF